MCRLHQNQYRAIRSDIAAITGVAEKLRTLILTEDKELSEFDKRIKARCCNLKLLEKIYKKYTEK